MNKKGEISSEMRAATHPDRLGTFSSASGYLRLRSPDEAAVAHGSFRPRRNRRSG
jgi:hypothetical protein